MLLKSIQMLYVSKTGYAALSNNILKTSCWYIKSFSGVEIIENVFDIISGIKKQK